MQNGHKSVQCMQGRKGSVQTRPESASTAAVTPEIWHQKKKERKAGKRRFPPLNRRLALVTYSHGLIESGQLSEY